MNNPQPLFDQGTYVNLVDLESTNSIWVSNRWINRQTDFLQDSINGISPRNNSVQTLFGKKLCQLHLVDYGGGSGWLFHNLSNSGFAPKKYTNVEIIDLHSSIVIQDATYDYVAIEDLNEKTWTESETILYFNSVIQYFNSNIHLLSLIEKISPKHLLIDDVTFSQNEEFFAYQKYYETRIPYRFLDKKRLISLLDINGYEIKHNSPYQRIISPEFSYTFEVNNPDFIIGDTESLYFERK
jgi:putative methyltransferase (TIGR04325 family)